MNDVTEKTTKIKRLGGYLHKIVPVVDDSGKIVQRLITPIMVEFRRRDVAQVLVGASILAIPLVYAEETWKLGLELPFRNVVIIALLSMVFIALFVYFNFYKNYLKGYVLQYLQRVFGIYFLSLVVVGVLLTLIQKCPWGVDNLLAIKRVIIIGLPASMSATVTDSLK